MKKSLKVEENKIYCDTCGKEVEEVKRVIVYTRYNRVLAKPIYNCKDCYKKKEKQKEYNEC